MSLLPLTWTQPYVNYISNPTAVTDGINASIGTTTSSKVIGATTTLVLGDNTIEVLDTATQAVLYVINPLNLQAVAPTLVPTILAINQTINLQNDDVTPTRTFTLSAGDPLSVGEFFGMQYWSNSGTDNFVVSTQTTGNMIFNQTGLGATTNFVMLNPSQINLEDTATLQSLTISKSAIDFYSTNGTSCVLIDDTHIHLNELVPTTTPFTTDITKDNIILQSNNLITPYLQTLTIQPNLVQHLNPDFSMIMGTGSYQTQALAVPRISTLNPYVCNVGFDGSSYQGDVNCLNVNCANNLQVSTINGLAPTTIGLVWSDFTNPYSSLPSNRYYLSDGTYETYQDTQQFYARNISSNQYASYDWNGIDANGGTFTLQTNSYNFDLYCATFNINGVPYSSGSSQDLTATLGYGNSAGGQSITNVNDINLVTINGSPYPPYPIAPYGLPSVLSIDATANMAINMNSNDINAVNNINLTTINGSPYPPTPSILNYQFVFQQVVCGNGMTTLFPTPTNLPQGTYNITWTIFFEALVGAGMINCYVDLYSYSYGNVMGTARTAGWYPSTNMSNDGGYQTTITYNDTYVISATDNWYPNFLQNNMSGWGFSNYTYLSAVATRIN